jgi:hypothetical protein
MNDWNLLQDRLKSGPLPSSVSKTDPAGIPDRLLIDQGGSGVTEQTSFVLARSIDLRMAILSDPIPAS